MAFLISWLIQGRSLSFEIFFLGTCTQQARAYYKYVIILNIVTQFYTSWSQHQNVDSENDETSQVLVESNYAGSPPSRFILKRKHTWHSLVYTQLQQARAYYKYVIILNIVTQFYTFCAVPRVTDCSIRVSRSFTWGCNCSLGCYTYMIVIMKYAI